MAGAFYRDLNAEILAQVFTGQDLTTINSVSPCLNNMSEGESLAVAILVSLLQ